MICWNAGTHQKFKFHICSSNSRSHSTTDYDVVVILYCGSLPELVPSAMEYRSQYVKWSKEEVDLIRVVAMFWKARCCIGEDHQQLWQGLLFPPTITAHTNDLLHATPISWLPPPPNKGAHPLPINNYITLHSHTCQCAWNGVLRILCVVSSSCIDFLYLRGWAEKFIGWLRRSCMTAMKLAMH